MKKFTLFVFLLFCLFSFSREISGNEPSDDSRETSQTTPIVWFVHGMVLTRDDFSPELDVLRKIYPKAEAVKLIKWNAPKRSPVQIGVNWSESLANADQFAPKLAQRIEEMTPEKRSRLILAGHSLGGRIVVRTAALCAKKNLKIRQVIIAGAAVDNDDVDIPSVWTFSKETVYNIINVNDIMLAAYKMAEGRSALGTAYLYKTDPDRFFEVVLEGSVEHYGFRYFERLLDGLKNDTLEYDGIIVPQDFQQLKFPTAEGTIWYDVVDSCAGWRLQQNQATGHCRILDPQGIRHAWGRLSTMKTAFEKVRFQLEQRTKQKEIPPDEIRVKQDFYNLERSTLGGLIWWHQLDEYAGWKLQQNEITGHCRILDSSDVRRACGKEKSMRASFDRVKRQLAKKLD